MRADLLSAGRLNRAEAALDADFESVFAAWFNAGFLELRRIDWETSAAVLERVIRYEAVHLIESWDDLRARVEPSDRRCYAFFHPQMPDDPLIFVEVALTRELPSAIGTIIDETRTLLDPHKASHAIFYSISNCQQGLKGVPFGNYLIKQVAELLCSELPQLSTFATLSPVPGFARWLAGRGGAGDHNLRAQAARYLVEGRGPKGGPLDSVARFHLGNGARLEAVHAMADPSPRGLEQSHGIMVNYVYDLTRIEENLLSLSELDTVACSKDVAALVREAKVAP
ncbi:MAG: malonyl-CoA decarboxylase family protein [Novosphingobium sp.]